MPEQQLIEVRVWRAGAQWPCFPLLCCTSNTSVRGTTAARGYQDAKRSSCLLSRSLSLPDSDVTFQSPQSASTCFSCFFTFLLTSTQIFITSGSLNVCLLGTQLPDAGICPTTKASSEILFLVCLAPKHKLPLWRMGCLMETLWDCRGVLITFLMCQIPSDFKPHRSLYSAPLWSGLETVFSLVLHFRATWCRGRVTLSRSPRSWWC